MVVAEPFGAKDAQRVPQQVKEFMTFCHGSAWHHRGGDHLKDHVFIFCGQLHRFLA